MLKRSREESPLATASTPGPPAKRLQTEPPEFSPVSSRSSTSTSTPHLVRTPRTPFSIPSDSPSNPFGLKKTLVALDLPEPLTFGRHLALRFQYIQERSPSTSSTPFGGRKPPLVFRVVQVPTNYTFRHLHKLIFFLFASDVGKHHSIRQPTPRVAKGKANAVSRALSLSRVSTASVNRRRALKGFPMGSASQSESWTGHVFEVHKAIKGQPLVGGEEDIKGVVLPTGKLWKKLSSVRERHIFRDLYDATDTDSGSGDGNDSEDENEWGWEAEDDLTLGHLWPKGPTLQRGIIYRHNSHISVHITVHNGSVLHRKGSGNLPFVFFSQGSAGDTIKISHDIQNQHNATGSKDDDDDIPTPPSSISTPSAQITRWNSFGTFSKFLKGEDDRERRLRGQLPSEYADQSSEGSLPPSDDIPFPSSEADSESDCSVYSDSVLFPFASSSITPFPAHPAHRKRVQSAERRLEKLTRSGLSISRLSDEEDEDDKEDDNTRAPSVEIPDGVVKERSLDFNPFIDVVNDEIEI